MFTKCSCQHCNGHIEFDSAHAGSSVKCPHCFEPTKLAVPENQSLSDQPIKINYGKPLREGMQVKPILPKREDEPFRGGMWEREPMSEKQKGMFVLYGIPLKEGLTKGEASQLINNAVNSGAKPTKETQAKACEIWGNYRLTKIVDEITKTIEIIADEQTSIKSLKEAKRKIKESVQSFTEMIDRRIETIQEENREIRYEKTVQWMKEHGYRTDS